jgi:hypothetical protein
METVTAEARPAPARTGLLRPILAYLSLFFCDENGTPDIGEVIIAAVVFALIIGAFTIRPFPLKTLGETSVALIPLYKITRGDWRR